MYCSLMLLSTTCYFVSFLLTCYESDPSKMLQHAASWLAVTTVTTLALTWLPVREAIERSLPERTTAKHPYRPPSEYLFQLLPPSMHNQSWTVSATTVNDSLMEEIANQCYREATTFCGDNPSYPLPYVQQQLLSSINHNHDLGWLSAGPPFNLQAY